MNPNATSDADAWLVCLQPERRVALKIQGRSADPVVRRDTVHVEVDVAEIHPQQGVVAVEDRKIVLGRLRATIPMVQCRRIRPTVELLVGC